MKKAMVLVSFLVFSSNIVLAAEVRVNNQPCRVVNAQISRDFKSVTIDCAGQGSTATIETAGLVEAKSLAELLVSEKDSIKISIVTVGQSMRATAAINFRQ